MPLSPNQHRAILHLPLVANLWPNCSGRCERNNTIDTENIECVKMVTCL